MIKIMQHMLAVTAVGVALAMPAASPAQTTNHYFTTRQKQEIVKIVEGVVAANGSITKQIHDRFWSLLPEAVQRDPKSFVSKLRTGPNMVYQEQLWESIRLSARRGKIIKTLYYETAFRRAHPSTTSAEHDARLADQMLRAAAHRVPFEINGRKRYLTEKLADKVLDHLNAATARLKRLLDPVWRGK